MTQLLETYWPALVIALALGLVIAWYVFNASRRTRVTGTVKDVLDDGASPAERNKALIDSAPAATRDPAAAPLPAAPMGGDDLTRIKGLGPKLAAQLAGLGVTSFVEVAAWDDAEIERIDSQLGRFQGRIRRDDWVGQARLLAAGDESGFSEKYGRLD
jgi:predicted flap endonuclease-1-like 5' DNA nuclease